MKSGQYYYFISGLPRLSMEDSKLQIEPAVFLEQAAGQLTEYDMKLLMLLTLETGIKTLCQLLYKEHPEEVTAGYYSIEFWQDFIEAARLRVENKRSPIPRCYGELPDFLLSNTVEFLSQEEPPPRLGFEHSQYAGLFEYAEGHKNAFIRDWFNYRRQARNIVLAINGRNHELDYARWLIGDDELSQNLATGRGMDFGIGKSNDLFDSYLRAYEQNPLLYRERTYDILSWKWIDQHNFFQYFSIDRILGYFAQLLILSRWMSMDLNLGKEVFFDTLQQLQDSFSFPAEFAIKQKNK